VVAADDAENELLDRIVAVVDEDPILLSDIRRVIALGLVERRPEEDDRGLDRRVLDDLIAQRLRSHEVDRYGFEVVPLELVEEQVEALRQRSGDPEAFEQRMSELGLDGEGVRRLLTRQLQVLIFVEERLGPRVFVSLEDIRAHYSEVLTPQLEEAGQSVPPLAEVREQIREMLRQERLNREIERWTEELRREADVIDQLDRPPRPLPPPVSGRG
jgi:hypothetical protein